MFRNLRLPLCVILAATGVTLHAEACTIFYATDGTHCFAGNNEDYADSNTFMWVVPGESGEHGRIYFGYANGIGQGGVNDAGLFFDYAATRNTPLHNTEGKKPYRDDLVDLVLRSCTTVDEAAALLDEYQIPHLERAMLMFGDATGGSIIYEGDDVLRRAAGARHQVLTNFYQSRTPADEVKCWRKLKAEEIFAAQFSHDEPASLDLMRDVLKGVYQKEGKAETTYSNVYDLKRGFIHLYLNHDFDRRVTLSVASELAKGARKVKLSKLFGAPEQLVAWPWNTNCPNSGKVVPRDREDCYFEHDGVRVYYCNPHCASDGGKIPEQSITRVYLNR